jgi:hypothetical protein
MDNYFHLQNLLDSSPAIRLLRERNAALVLYFLRTTFEEGQTSIAADSVVARLADFLEQNAADSDLEEDGEKTDAPDDTPGLGLRDSLFWQRKARLLLQKWEDKERRYVSMFNNERGEQFYRLTPYFAKAVQWVEGLERREFVGAHSRFEDVLKNCANSCRTAARKHPKSKSPNSKPNATCWNGTSHKSGRANRADCPLTKPASAKSMPLCSNSPAL